MSSARDTIRSFASSIGSPSQTPTSPGRTSRPAAALPALPPPPSRPDALPRAPRVALPLDAVIERAGYPGLPVIEKQLWALAAQHVEQVPQGRMADWTQASEALPVANAPSRAQQLARSAQDWIKAAFK